MRPEEVDALRRLVQSRSGVMIDPAKTYLVETRLAPLARREGFPTHLELLAAMRQTRDDRLIWAVTEAMTSSDTEFFRDKAVFDHFRETILPSFAGRKNPVRIWSAACAAGQEPYSIAMALAQEQSRLEGTQVELFGSDLSEAALEKARSGLYTQFEVQRGLPIRLLVEHFERQGEMWRLDPKIVQKVRWRRINLLADLTPLGQFDVIFCRYLLSTFEPAMKKRVLEQLRGLLTTDGYLLLGPDESIEGIEGLHPVAGAEGVYSPSPAYRAAAA